MNTIDNGRRVLLTKLAIAGAVALSGVSASADEVIPDQYRMAVISDASYGDRLLAGDAGFVIDALENRETRTGDRFTVSNNLCVAYTMAKDVEMAAQACAEAVRYGRRTPGASIDAFARSQAKRRSAIALSNRGVLRALTGDADGAFEDFKRAKRSYGRLDEPAENLARLRSKVDDAVVSL